MDFMKKCWIGSGLQNFHIRTPLDCASEMSGLSYFAIQNQSRILKTQSKANHSPKLSLKFELQVQIKSKKLKINKIQLANNKN